MSTLKTNAITTVAGKPILNSTGSILQVVQTTTNSTISVTTSTLTASGFIASITPSSTTSKILVRLSGGNSNYGSSSCSFYASMYRSIGGGSYSSLYGMIYYIMTSTYGYSHSSEYLDSPATTSSVSYQPYIGETGSSRGDLNYGGFTPNPILTLTLLEISG